MSPVTNIIYLSWSSL